jgi:hypothetical protein
MRYTLVTETWPPEVNGVALTVQGLALGLCARGHAVEVVRPRQSSEQQLAATGEGTLATLLVRGAALPRYPGLRFGLPAARALLRHWTQSPPDAVYIATEGPLGWSAMRAARHLGIPVASGCRCRIARNDCTASSRFFSGATRPTWIATRVSGPAPQVARRRSSRSSGDNCTVSTARASRTTRWKSLACRKRCSSVVGTSVASARLWKRRIHASAVSASQGMP